MRCSVFLCLLDMPSHSWCNVSPAPNEEIRDLHSLQQVNSINSPEEQIFNHETCQVGTFFIILCLCNSCTMQPYRSYKKNGQRQNQTGR